MKASHILPHFKPSSATSEKKRPTNKMATFYNHNIQEEEDDYIDMELSSFSNLFSHATNTASSLQAIEFQFQLSSSTDHDSESTILPADQLFYNGKLLPLHLTPRLQMLQNSTTDASSLAKSCGVSLSASFRLTADYINDYFHKWSTEVSDDHLIGVDVSKKSWSNKNLKLIKKFLAGQKIKHVKSLFSKSNCSNESCTRNADVKREAANMSQGKYDYLSKHIKLSKKILQGDIAKEVTFPTVASFMKLSSNQKVRSPSTYNISHQESFSGAIKQHSSSSSSRSSSSSSKSSSLSFDTSSTGSIIELGTIESAIAHCKMSQQSIVEDAEYWSFTV